MLFLPNQKRGFQGETFHATLPSKKERGVWYIMCVWWGQGKREDWGLPDLVFSLSIEGATQQYSDYECLGLNPNLLHAKCALSSPSHYSCPGELYWFMLQSWSQIWYHSLFGERGGIENLPCMSEALGSNLLLPPPPPQKKKRNPSNYVLLGECPTNENVLEPMRALYLMAFWQHAPAQDFPQPRMGHLVFGCDCDCGNLFRLSA